MLSGKITVQVAKTGRTIILEIAGVPLPRVPGRRHFIEEILDVPEGSVTTVERHGDGTAFCISLPAVEHTVVVVDDNQDMALFTGATPRAPATTWSTWPRDSACRGHQSRRPRRSCSTSCCPTPTAGPCFHTCASTPTATIPVIVCLVVREEELAMALGAALYLRKPIQRDQFIAALDQAVSRPCRSAPQPGPDRIAEVASEQRNSLRRVIPSSRVTSIP